MSRRTYILAVTAALAVLTTTTGCGLFGIGHSDPERGQYDERFVLLNKPHNSPSGQYTASVIAGPDQNGVETRVVVISDSTGKEVFHDDMPYSTRHGLGVTWLSTKDQLWIMSGDIGTSYVQSDGSIWTKTSVTPETRKDIPQEIQELKLRHGRATPRSWSRFTVRRSGTRRGSGRAAIRRSNGRSCPRA